MNKFLYNTSTLEMEFKFSDFDEMLEFMKLLELKTKLFEI